MVEIFKLLGGLMLLFVSGDYLVKGGVGLARHLKISTMVIAVTVVAFGTSAPELIVSLQAAVKGHPDIAVGNVIGSNISNIALVLACSAIILPIAVKSNSIKFDWPIMMGSAILFVLFSLNYELQRYESLILFFGLLFFIVKSVRKSRKEHLGEEVKAPEFSMFMAVLFIVLSCVGLAFGSSLLVSSAEVLAIKMGVSERVISISVVAFGTSVPELVTSVMAAIRKETDISIGNIIGSNIFNTLAVLGITGMVTPIGINNAILKVDIHWMNAIYLLLFLFILPLKGGTLTRIKASLLLVVYVLYIYNLFI